MGESWTAWKIQEGSTNEIGVSPVITASHFLAKVVALYFSLVTISRKIDGNYRVITLIFTKYGDLPLCLENYALFSLPPILQNIYIHIH